MAKTNTLSEKVSVPSLVDIVTQRVEEAIMSGELEPGSKIREQTLARSLASDGIRVNVVAPGYFDTGRVNRRVRALMAEKGVPHAQAVAEVSGGVPAGRLGTAEELAELVTFVASRKAGFMTGAMLTIDGGGCRGVL